MLIVFSRGNAAVLQLLETSRDSNQMDLHIGNIIDCGNNRNRGFRVLRPSEVVAQRSRWPSRLQKQPETASGLVISN